MSVNYPSFNYAGLEPAGEYLQELRIDEGKSALVNFLQDIPGMQNPPFVFCKVHWISEIGDKGRLIQCFGGQCCEQVTWQKGWNGQPGKFEATKPKQRFFIPVVQYEADPANPAQSRATVKYMNMTWTAYNALVTTINNTVEGLSFFDRDITLTARKVNGATDYLYDKKETQAQWKTNPVFKAQVEEQLPNVAQRLKNAMPMFMDETTFMQMKPQLDAKVQAAMRSHQQQTQPAPQAAFGSLPGQVPPMNNMQPMQASQLGQVPPVQPMPQPMYQQPQVNIPVQPNLNVQGVTVPGEVPPAQPSPALSFDAQGQMTQQAQPAEQPAQEQTVIPKVDLEFDPSQLLR